MASQTDNRYIPDYVVTPGAVLEDYLDSLGMPQAELSRRTGLTTKTINEIIKSKSSITPDTALKLEKVLGRPAHFWNALEAKYQEDKGRLKEEERFADELSWVDRFPYGEMAKLGWVPKLKDKSGKFRELLQYFGVASPEQWDVVWEHNTKVAFRQSAAGAHRFEAISAWLRQGELCAQTTSTCQYDAKKFSEVLREIRLLTREEPAIFEPKLRELCNSAGVVFVCVRELSCTGVYGATRWLNGRPLMQLCLYRKTNDQFWFSFFHEAAHILKHGKGQIFIESKSIDCEKEQEANAWARDHLVPQNALHSFLSTSRPTLDNVVDFAKQIGIAPGIVVGRLQFDKVLPHTTGNKLKVSFRWNEKETR